MGVEETRSAATDLCSCCGWPRAYDDSRFWYCDRWPNWFWWRAARVVCFLVGHRKNCRYGDCYRCG